MVDFVREEGAGDQPWVSVGAEAEDESGIFDFFDLEDCLVIVGGMSVVDYAELTHLNVTPTLFEFQNSAARLSCWAA